MLRHWLNATVLIVSIVMANLPNLDRVYIVVYLVMEWLFKIIVFATELDLKRKKMYEMISIYKIKNGSKISIGSDVKTLDIIVDRHFNWFQKRMIKWCFGFTVEDYSEE